jgi:hypothetical protein
MLKKIVPIGQEIIKVLKTTKATILPFLEEPAEKTEENKNGVSATELFSLFTANIIQEEVVFLR